MIVSAIGSDSAAGRRRVSAVFELESGKLFGDGARSNTLFFEWPEEYFDGDVKIDPFIVAALPIAMAVGEDLLCDGPISESLYLNLLEVINIYNYLYPEITSPIELKCPVEFREMKSSHRIASFYSGGIDSLFNVAECMRLREACGVGMVSDLWLVHGMDISLDNNSLWEETRDRLFDSAKSLGAKNIIDIATNIRTLHDGLVYWSLTGYSSVMGAIAKCFAEEVSVVLIGSFGKYEEIFPVGFRHPSSPLVDVLWGCELQQIRHFTSRVSRMEKVKVVVDRLPEVLKDLRVCYKNYGAGEYNCGACEKCVRTRLQLMVCGYQEQNSNFAVPLNPGLIKGLDLGVGQNREYWLSFWKEIESELYLQNRLEYAQAVSAALEVRNESPKKKGRKQFRFFRAKT